MADLRAVLGSLGYDVRTLLQSGNAVFVAGDDMRSGTASTLERAIRTAIGSELGVDVGALVRSAEEVAAIVDANPFVAAGADPTELHAVFLAAAPPAAAIDALDPTDFEPDQFALGDRPLYLRMPNGVMGSRLPDWTKVLGQTVTQPSWNTVLRVHALTGAAPRSAH